MLPDLALEVLSFFDRAALERLQMHSRYLRNLVNHQARTLSLRYIHEVDMSGLFVVARIRLQKDAVDGITLRDPRELRLGVLFHRINNAYIHRLTLDFHNENIRQLTHLQANANELQCRIGTLCVEGLPIDIDYALVDFLGVHLKPELYETSIWILQDDYALLFTHDALRGSIKHLVYGRTREPAPNCIIPELFGVDVVESCAITTVVDPRPWIAKFIESFEMAERGMDIVRSVTLLHMRCYEESPLRDVVGPLRQPLHTNTPTHSSFVREWLRKQQLERGANTVNITESGVAELFLFENAKSAKRLEVFMWTLEQQEDDERTSLHYAFLLQTTDM